MEKPDMATQTCCVLCLKDGMDAAIEHAFIVSGYSMCTKHTQAFFAARQSPDNFIAAYAAQS